MKKFLYIIGVYKIFILCGYPAIHKLVCPENNADCSILLFELLVSIFLYKSPNIELKILPEINRVTYSGVDNSLGKELFNLLKELENDTTGNKHLEGNITHGSIECKRTINLTYYYLYTLFSKETKYAGNRIRNSAEELKVCQKFIEIAQLLT